MNPDPVAVHHIRPVLTFSALQRDVIRTVAFLAMAGDHLATAFQADLPLLNMAGRCAFPLFALVSGCNLTGKSIRQRSLNRLWLMALWPSQVTGWPSGTRDWSGGNSISCSLLRWLCR